MTIKWFPKIKGTATVPVALSHVSCDRVVDGTPTRAGEAPALPKSDTADNYTCLPRITCESRLALTTNHMPWSDLVSIPA